MNEQKKNVVASVLTRLKNKADATGANYNQLMQAYAIERFLHRVSKSPHAHGVILKGALLLKTIGLPRARPTMDIDLLRKGRADRDSLTALVKECAAIHEEDGLTFLPESVVASDIDKDSGYVGTRIQFDARMSNVRLKIQIDFGVGDVMTPGPRMIVYPTILNGGDIHLQAYPVQSAIAEKLQAMVALGKNNSRMKDFYDVWTCSNHLDFNESILDAIAATFKKRGTTVPTEAPLALTPEFVESHRVQWNAFVKKIGEKDLVDDFGKVVADIHGFAMPAFAAVASGSQITPKWKAGQGWSGLEVDIEMEEFTR